MNTHSLLFTLSLSCIASATLANVPNQISGNEFNPAISLILDGRYTSIDQSELELPGFQLGGEAGLPQAGFSTGHNELVMSANIDDRFYGLINAALIVEDGSTSIELEEAYFETLKLGSGFSLKGGQFLSGFGYLNSIHLHAHDFSDRPLVYDALMGGHLIETGLQARWVAPTDFFFSIGTEVTTGSAFPGGETEKNNNGLTFFAKIGGDLGQSSSWQLGASFYQSEFDVREAGGHHHGHSNEEESADNELLNGEVEVMGVDLVYKWAPRGNSKQTNLKLQAEYLVKQEYGQALLTEADNSAQANYEGEQDGYYVQAIYQFMPSWRIGLRHETLTADNLISNFTSSGIDEEEFLEESGLGTEDDDPTRESVMIDYSPTHFSRIRLQYSQLDNGHSDTNDMIALQYTMSLGSHGAHSF